MVVDDSPTIRKIIGLALAGEGYRILEATDGASALVELDNRRDENIALILCDVNMPNVNGLEFIRRLRSLERYRFTPVIMLTTESGEHFEAEAAQAGVRAWIRKPFQAQDLVAAIRRFVI